MDKGIIFSAAMVRALVDGRKTQTRRLVKPVTHAGVNPDFSQIRAHPHGERRWMLHGSEEASEPFKVPYAPGDRLYVREAFTVRGIYSDVVEVGYRACERRSHTEFVEQWPIGTAKDAKGKGPKVTWPAYKPSIHMPRWASRLTLLVTDVRVQRVAEISEADAKAEGIQSFRPHHSVATFHHHTVPEHRNYGFINARRAFEDLWNSLHTKPGETWADNPWVVAVSFDVRPGNIDRSEG